jgi:mRNA interferase MazF
MEVGVSRFEIYLVTLDPTVGSEIRRTRPCVVVSPEELNNSLRTTMVAPLTTGGKPYPFRVSNRVDGRPGKVLLDQLRSVDQSRLVRRLGVLDERTCQTVLHLLRELFAD